MTPLELREVSRNYGGQTFPALNGVTLTVQTGEVVAILGASGSGKTTLLNMAAGLDRPTRGSVRVLGRDLTAMGESQLALFRRAHLGFVFQTLNLIPTLTAAENIELPLALVGQSTTARRDRAVELLEKAGLADRAHALPDELSTGQQQRVAVLRAMAHRPAMVLMDEPTSALDSHTAERLMDLVLELNRAEQTTVLVATHDTRISAMLSRSVRLRDGRLVNPQESRS
jgi:putative ABC transport system ATP-binding protein